jgi:TetR/AcrR family transcriptional regulator, mexJK operon transcriptional repressor
MREPEDSGVGAADIKTPTPRPKGGRPTAADAVRLEATILDRATACFLRDGYAATSIESIARLCSVAKRTIYARWSGKPALFMAILQRLMAKWLATSGTLTDSGDLKENLVQAADKIMAVALSPEAIALHRLLIAESARFPELPVMMRNAGSHEGVVRISGMLRDGIARGQVDDHDTIFAAEQFLHLLLSGPRRRAIGLGPALDAEAMTVWRDKAILLFLGGLNSLRLLQPAKK